jgi:hypothetical protein
MQNLIKQMNPLVYDKLKEVSLSQNHYHKEAVENLLLSLGITESIFQLTAINADLLLKLSFTRLGFPKFDLLHDTIFGYLNTYIFTEKN